MTTLSSIVNTARAAFPNKIELRYVHPTLYLVCIDEKFSGHDDGTRQQMFAEKTKLAPESFQKLGLGSVLSLILATVEERKRDYDFLDQAVAGQHWLPLLDATTLADLPLVANSDPRSIHFYGYKGGQARSSVLAMLAQQLADDGYKVLVIDADVEAPSLDSIFRVAANLPSQTLLGLVLPDNVAEPLSAYTASDGGRVDLLACRPAGAEYDMDFAAFVLRTALDITALEEGLARFRRKIAQQAENLKYDLVLFDHRSGLTTSVLPIIKACPGPVVVCLRLDTQSQGATRLFEVLFRQTKDTPGAFVSFSLDPEDSREKMLGSRGAQINEMLEKLGAAIERGSTEYATSDKDLPPEDFMRYWVSWLHDRAFLAKPLPALSELGEANRRSLLQLREVLGFSGRRTWQFAQRKTSGTIPASAKLSPSGAADDGIFIETQEIARLFQANTPINYVFGRKGTGKTRLLRELQKRNLGEPLVVAADAEGGGLPSGDAIFTDMASAWNDEPEKLWWSILSAALMSENTSHPSFRANLRTMERRSRAKRRTMRVSDVAELAAKTPRRRIFLIDGIETAFRANKLIEFVEALFKFMLTVQSDSNFSDKVVIRLFLRTDLAKRAIQNVEQQTSGRRLDLTWNTQSIFNFVLSRISQLDWFQENFKDACGAIVAENERIKAGLLSADEYEPLLLEVFPRHLRRNNLQTLTFLKTYFSDAAGDDETRAAFYPRLFDAFLHFIAHDKELPHGSSPANAIEDSRIHQGLVLSAHEAASRKFLDEVKQELTVLLYLAKRSADNEQRVSELLTAFDGLPTPFVVDECLKKLRPKVSKVSPDHLREALNRMKEVGMFEQRPGYSGSWRAGRLFKSALRMKYVRK
jgi:MinD-like ATPase involved in chromosome partitioning or flagellar assembly